MAAGRSSGQLSKEGGEYNHFSISGFLRKVPESEQTKKMDTIVMIHFRLHYFHKTWN